MNIIIQYISLASLLLLTSSGPMEVTQEVSSKQDVASEAREPIRLDWKTLINIDFVPQYFEEHQMEYLTPKFTEYLKSLDGKEVVIEGFVIPFDEEGEYVALSANPYASCFFCGNASMASIMSLYLKDKSKRYKMDDYLTFKGILTVNNTDPEEFCYVLNDAVEVN